MEEERKKESGKEREKKITVGLVTVTFLLNLFLPHPQACRFMKSGGTRSPNLWLSACRGFLPWNRRVEGDLARREFLQSLPRSFLVPVRPRRDLRELVRRDGRAVKAVVLGTTQKWRGFEPHSRHSLFFVLSSFISFFFFILVRPCLVRG